MGGSAGVGMVAVVGGFGCVEQIPWQAWSMQPIVDSVEMVM